MNLNDFRQRYAELTPTQHQIVDHLRRAHDKHAIKRALDLTEAQYRYAVDTMLRHTGAINTHRLVYLITRVDAETAAGPPTGDS